MVFPSFHSFSWSSRISVVSAAFLSAASSMLARRVMDLQDQVFVQSMQRITATSSDPNIIKSSFKLLPHEERGPGEFWQNLDQIGSTSSEPTEGSEKTVQNFSCFQNTCSSVSPAPNHHSGSKGV